MTITADGIALIAGILVQCEDFHGSHFHIDASVCKLG